MEKFGSNRGDQGGTWFTTKGILSKSWAHWFWVIVIILGVISTVIGIGMWGKNTGYLAIIVGVIFAAIGWSRLSGHLDGEIDAASFVAFAIVIGWQHLAVPDAAPALRAAASFIAPNHNSSRNYTPAPSQQRNAASFNQQQGNSQLANYKRRFPNAKEYILQHAINSNLRPSIKFNSDHEKWCKIGSNSWKDNQGKLNCQTKYIWKPQ